MNRRFEFIVILPALFVLSILLVGNVYAEDPNGIHGYYRGENSDAVDMFTGTLTITQNDLTLPGRNGLDVIINRIYSSDTEYGADPGPEETPQWGPAKPAHYLGQGWHYLIGRIHDDTLYYGDGSSEHLFVGYGYPDSMYRTRQFAMVTRHDSVSADTMFMLNGMKMVFDTTDIYSYDGGVDQIYGGKYVSEIIDAHGNKISIDYFDDYPYIQKITDTIGRIIDFDYDQDTTNFTETARVTAIKYKNWDNSLISVDYSYDQDGNLTKVKYPSGDSIQYEYADTAYWDGEYLTLSSYKLSKVTLPYGGEYSYDWEIFKKWRYDEAIYQAVPCSVWCDELFGLCYPLEICPPDSCPPGGYMYYYDICDYELVGYTPNYSWSTNIRSITRLYDSTADSTKLSYQYATSECVNGADGSGNISSVLYPDSSFNVYWHSGHDPGEENQNCYGFPANILSVYRQYEGYVETPDQNDTTYENQWFVGEFWPWFYFDSDANNVAIGSEFVDSTWQTVYVPVVYNTESTIRVSEGDSTINYANRSGYDPHTGAFATTSYFGGSDSTVVAWDSTTNRSHPEFRKTVDNKYGYSRVDSTRFIWDTTEFELDEVRNFIGNDSLVTKFKYDQYGNQDTVIYPTGDSLFFEYSAACSSAFLTRAFSSSVDYDFYKMDYYINVGAKKWETSPNGDTTFYEYDDANRLEKIIRPLESGSFSVKSIWVDSLKMKIDSVRVDSSLVRKSISEFNEFNWPVKVEREGNIYSDIEYDNMGRIKRTNRPHTEASDTVWTEMFYDRLGRKYKTIYPDGESDSTYYDDFYSESFDRMGRKTKTLMDEYFQVSMVVYDTTSSPDTLKYEYGPWGKVLKEIDPRGLITKYWYDERGRLQADSSVDKGQRYYYYDNGNNLRLAKDATGVWKYVKYDKMGRGIEIGTAINPDTTRLDEEDYPDTNYTWFVKKKYDDYSASYAGVDSTILNAKGNLTEIEDQSGKTVFFYDDRNRLAMKLIEIDGLTGNKRIWYHYNRADQLTKIVYPDSSAVDYEYYDNGRLSRIPGFVEASDIITGIKPGITYEPWGGVKSITYFQDNDYADTYSYDDYSHLEKINSKIGSTEFWGQTYHYDDMGNVTLNYGLDSLGVEDTGDTLGFYVYDYTYDLIEANVKSGAVEKHLDYGYYDKSGNREYKKVDADSTHYFLADSLLQYFADNVTVNCSASSTVDIDFFVPANLDTISWHCSIEGDRFNRANFKIFNDDTTYVNENIRGEFDPNDQGTFIPVSEDTLTIRIELTSGDGEANGRANFTNEGNFYHPTNKLSHLSEQSSDNFVYDEAGRLVADSAGGKQYTYNDLGQLTKYTKDGYDRLLFEYDYSGARVKKTVITGVFCDSTEWSIDNHNDECEHDTSTCWFVPGDVDGDDDCDGNDVRYLSAYLFGSIPPPPPPPYPIFRADVNCDGSINGVDVTYLNNYLTQQGSTPKCCYWIQTDTVSTYYIYSQGRVIAEYDDSGDLAWNYAYGLGQRMARFNGSDKQIYHNDHLGNVRAITDTSGAIVAKVDYYPFGEELGLTGAPGRFTYNGNELDDEYGFDLYYYGARYMDPALGRFTTPDPIRDFVNPYSYVRNNPVNAIDPTGMATSGLIYSVINPATGRFNPFWWVSDAAYNAWKKGNTSQAELDWRDSLVEAEKDKADNNKSSNEAEEIKEGTPEGRSPVPGDPDFVGPVSPGTQATYYLKKAFNASNQMERDYYLAAAFQAAADPDFVYVAIGVGQFTGLGVEAGIVVDRWGQGFLIISGTLSISSGLTGEAVVGWFTGDDVTREQSYDFFSSVSGGISALGGIAYDVTVDGGAFGVHAVGMGAFSLGVFVGYPLITWGR